MPGDHVSEQPEGDQPPGVTVVDNPDGITQTIYATANLEAAVTTGNDEENS